MECLRVSIEVAILFHGNCLAVYQCGLLQYFPFLMKLREGSHVISDILIVTRPLVISTQYRDH